MQEIVQNLSNMTEEAAASPWQRAGSIIRSYIQLTKPRIIVLLLISTAAAMALAGGGDVDPVLFLATLAGGALAAGSANAINCFYDRDIDSIMVRTQKRPIPSGQIRPRDALLFAIVLGVASFGLLTWMANLLAALLAMAGIGCYVVVYTHWLKRHSPHNIVIGGAAGAIPPLVGWAAVTGTLDWPAWALFWIIFLWTPPHFWALALMIRDDYASVGVPMLPVVSGDEATAKQILGYSIALVPLTLALAWPLGETGWLYGAIALILGGILVQKSWQLLALPSDRAVARDLFKYSIGYLMLLCAGAVLAGLPVTHSLQLALFDQVQSLWLAIAA
ncbi:MAG: protoheme IX farnesyltransferase [Limnothrix sp. CACIAM 69d]|uniref:Protoheme IX farnesyltransferase n=1 Tax=Limnothrix redekei LRLZ20PSL1 TaxID=3112953 RepID=A0ABW7C935_9CYAN|nr:MAG: protoheme IX farnesyltransferase [Limnothrix sp. CACIAM 69d]